MAVFYQLDGEADGSEILNILNDHFTYLEDQSVYEDKTFVAGDSSIGTEMYCKDINETITWLRPKDILEKTNTTDEPEFFVDGPSRCDINQGDIGDCWFLAAVAALAMNEDLLYQVVPKDQSFQEDYNGTFHFRFWHFGKWKDVIVDDFLPTYQDDNGKLKLIGLHSAVNNEFWPALLEKAYAKLYGSYQALDGGYFTEATEDFTGGISEIIYTAHSNRPGDLYGVLLEAWDRKSLIGCDFKTQLDLDDEDNEFPENDDSDTRSGLIADHTYSITHVGEVNVGMENSEVIRILRLRNPWGDGHEWKGAWSDDSKMWESVSDEEKEKLDWKNSIDGEFWMSFEDFKRCCSSVEICHFNLNDSSDSTDEKNLRISEFEGAWVRGATAGGCKCDPEMFCENPQYRLTLEEESTVIVVLVQKNRRTKDLNGSDFRKIGLSIYPLEGEPSQPLDSEFLANATVIQIDSDMGKGSASCSTPYTALRSVSCRLKLNPGVYFIIPSVLNDYIEGEFLLRVVSDNNTTVVEEYDQKLRFPTDEDLDKIFDDEKFNNEELVNIFNKVSAMETNELEEEDWKKSFDKTMYNSGSYTGGGFSRSNCDLIMATLQSKKDDSKYSEKYVKRIMILGKAFNEYASEGGFIEARYLRAALNTAAYFLDNHTLCNLVRDYRTRKDKDEDMGTYLIKFDDFITCAIKVAEKFDESSEL